MFLPHALLSGASKAVSQVIFEEKWILLYFFSAGMCIVIVQAPHIWNDESNQFRCWERATFGDYFSAYNAVGVKSPP